MESRNKRDLPEVVAEILIEQHAMREDIAGMREDISSMRGDIAFMREGSDAMRGDIALMRGDSDAMRGDIGALRYDLQQSNIELREEIKRSNDEVIAVFNNMTNAILDAITRGTERYNLTNNRVDDTNIEVDGLKKRVTKLEDAAGLAG